MSAEGFEEKVVMNNNVASDNNDVNVNFVR
jgi:hypothetical protein